MSATTSPEVVSAPTPRPRLGGLRRWSADYANPLLVRYVRQQLRSKAFIAVFSSVLGLALLCSLAVGAAAGHRQEGRAALMLLGFLCAIWTFAVWVWEPINAYRAAAHERDTRTWDLIRLTGMRPGQILRGMFFASMVQGLVYALAIAPFMVMAYLLRGIEIEAILMIMLFIPVCGWCASAGAIFMGCLGFNKGLRIALLAVVAVFAGLIWFITLQFWLNLEDGGFIFFFFFDVPDVTAFIAVTSSFAALWIVGSLTMGSALIQTRGASRSAGPRVVMFAIGFAWVIWAMIAAGRDPEEGLHAGGTAMVIYAYLMGIFAVSEDYALTPRQARAIQRARWWRLPRLFGSGAARGRTAFLTLASLGLLISAAGAMSRYGDEDAFTVTALAFAYATILLALGDLFARRVFKAGSPLVRRLIVLATLGVLTFLAIIGTQLIRDENPIELLSPIPGLALVGDNPHDYEGGVIIILMFGIVAAIALFVQSLRETETIRRTPAEPT